MLSGTARGVKVLAATSYQAARLGCKYRLVSGRVHQQTAALSVGSTHEISASLWDEPAEKHCGPTASAIPRV